MNCLSILGFLFLLSLILLFIFECIPNIKYSFKPKMNLKCSECKQSKKYIYCSDNYTKYEKKYITFSSERIPTYCRLTRREVKKNSTCLLPKFDNEKQNNDFIKSNQEINFYPSNENSSKIVFVILSGNRYHAENCSKIQNSNIYSITVSTACRLGLHPCSYCKPPK